MITLISSLVFIWWFIGIATVAIIIALESEKEGLASTFFSLVIGLLLWNYSSEILAFVTTNYLEVIGFLITYFLIGIGWSFLKWNSKVKGIFKKLGEIQRKYLNDEGILPENSLSDLNKEISSSRFRRYNNSDYYYPNSDTKINETVKTIRPKGDEYKSVIVAWISYWPLSLIGTLVNNPFRQFFSWVYESVSGTYDKFTQNQIDNYIN